MVQIDSIYSLFRKHPLISTDSRNIIPDSIFFCLKGDQFDGNNFALDAINKGAAYAVTDDPSLIGNDHFLPVPDVLTALQQLASMHRNKVQANIIGITGSNGKTTTKELIGRVLSSTFNTVITRGNLNNHIGVPLTILSIGQDTSFAVVEMGANHPGEIENLCHMARPQFGIITNIGKAHLEGFGNFQGVINAKSELFRFVAGENGTLFINEDNELLVRLSEGMKKYSYGRSSLAWCKGETIKNDPFLEVIWNAGHQRGIVNTGLYGSYNFENVMAAITIGVYFGVAPAEIDNSIRLYQPENNRSQVTLTENNTLLMDAYNANPSSMTAALENFGSYNASAKMVILGDMMELGVHSIIEHKEIIQLVRKYQFDRVCLVGENFSLAAGTGNELKFPDLKTAEKWFREHPVRNMTILIKGSRKMQLEKLNYLF